VDRNGWEKPVPERAARVEGSAIQHAVSLSEYREQVWEARGE